MSETTQEQPVVAADPVPEPTPQVEATPQVSGEATVDGTASTARVSEIKVSVDGAVLAGFAEALREFSVELREHISAEFSKLHRRL
ncbi:MAG: hypothetical protein P4L90_26090 [Rhodopila sp.]|nr:hypothetical protein [Rhodopila sp.]